MKPWERWLEMAQDSLQSARDLGSEHSISAHLRSAVSRYYYAAYQAVTAVLLYLSQIPPDNREAWSHAETPDFTVNVFARVLRSRKQRQHMQRELSTLYKMRCDADYVSIVTIDKDIVKTVGKSSRYIVRQCEDILLGGREDVRTRRSDC